ncbi:putative sensor with HAMP domain protein [Stackebrandtia nassauensis DSM 44728]|uniref:histidine kinase n=2 Tax=Stackebrandtia TaxID=283810 RepID=D3PXL9_STANL|nr:putative sensor with HAMP domain protein [Stackebrandtia nassauensis DSM 44728]
MTILKIRHKITFLVVVPLLAVFVFAALAVVTTGGEAVRADQLRKMVIINDEIGDLVSALQAERGAAVETLTGDADDSTGSFTRLVDKTDRAIDDFRAARVGVADLPGRVGDILDEADKNLNRLESTRNKVSNRTQTSAAVAFAYRIPIADLIEFRESVPQAGSASSEVGDKIRASTQLLQSSEYQSLEDVAVLRAIDNGPLSELHYGQIVESGSASDEMRLTFKDLADSEWRGWLENSRDGAKMIAAQALEHEAAGTPPGEELNIDRSAWVKRIDYLAGKQRELQGRVDGDVVTTVSQLRTDQMWWTGAQVLGVVVAVILMVLLAWWLGGPVVRGLRKLSKAAHYVASEGLPKAVAHLDDHEELGDRTPEEFAKEVDAPIDVHGRDELADVGRAFNEVHEVAIRVAATQALLRLHIGQMFVRLARRGHSLAGRLTSVLDDAERNEDDPQRLERLFALDHLVTLFGRANDSLLVLGGAASSKVRRSSESLGDVLTAAQGQIEQYTRVNIDQVDTDVAIAAGAVDDVVKVLAELLDNATQYSQRPVHMSGWMLADRVIIQIVDEGIGMKAETMDKLNAKLASKSTLDLDSVQAMGLTVVGHLAARYDLTVTLRPTEVGGTLAEVTVPSRLLERPSTTGSHPIVTTPKQPSLFDKTKKAENRRRNAETWRRRFQTGTPSPTAEQPVVTTETGESTQQSLGALLLPVIHFDKQPPPPQPPRQSRPDSVPQEQIVEQSGWARAQAAAEAAAAARADSENLPRREPMAQLVPGGMEAPDEDVAQTVRNPDLVSATYLAFARGRSGGRIDEDASDGSRGEQ